MSKKIYLVGIVLAGTLGLALNKFSESGKFGTYHKFYPSPNSSTKNIAGNTGAPGESTCASCHGASLKVGGSESTMAFKDSADVVVTDYKPNHTYNLTFSLSSSGRKGFQVIPLDANNKEVGTLIAGTETMLLTANNKQYLNHSNANNSSWTFKWKAPATNVGDITFYVAAGNLSAIYKSTYKLSAFVDTTNQGGGTDTTKTNGIKINENNFEFNAFYVAASQHLYVKYEASLKGDAFINVVDMNGRSVAYKKLGAVNGTSAKETEIPFVAQPGTYIVNMFVNNYMSTKKIVVF